MIVFYNIKSGKKVLQKCSFHRKEVKTQILKNTNFYDVKVLLRKKFSYCFSIIMMECSESSSHETAVAAELMQC